MPSGVRVRLPWEVRGFVPTEPAEDGIASGNYLQNMCTYRVESGHINLWFPQNKKLYVLRGTVP